MEGGQQQQREPRVPISTAGGASSPYILNVNIQAEHNESICETENFQSGKYGEISQPENHGDDQMDRKGIC